MGGGATFSAFKTFVKEILTVGDMNSSITTIIDNLDPTGIGDQSDDVATMQTQTDPYGSATESLAVALAGEIYRLRYVLAQIMGEDYWYYDVDSSLAKLLAGEHQLVTKTTTYTILTTDGIILADASGGAFTLTLPVVSGNEKKIYFIKKIDTSSNTVTIDADGTETIDKVLNYFLRTQNDFVMLCCDGTSWYILGEKQRANILEYQNLVVFNNATNPTYQMDITADALDLESSTGVVYRAKSVSLTGDLDTSGANGLDTGTKVDDTTYAIWVIYNPTTNTLAALFSANFTLSTITLPTDYTFGRLVGFCRNVTGGAIIPFYQNNEILLYDDPLDDTSVLTDGGVNTWTDVDCTNFAGNSALVKQALLGWTLEELTTDTTSYGYVRRNSATGNGRRVGPVTNASGAADYGQFNSGELWIPLDSSLLFEYKVGSGTTADMDVWVHGLKLNI